MVVMQEVFHRALYQLRARVTRLDPKRFPINRQSHQIASLLMIMEKTLGGKMGKFTASKIRGNADGISRLPIRL